MNCMFCFLVATVSLLVACVYGARRRQKVVATIRALQFIAYYPALMRRSSAPANCDDDTVSDWRLLQPLAWAHAGGGNPVMYGNAMENFDAAIKNGFRCLEVDVGLTCDNVPVLTHMFRPNWENLYVGTPSLKQFIETRIADKYTPLTLDDFLERYGDFDGWLFLDGLSFKSGSRFDFMEYFAAKDKAVKSKIIVQVFNFCDLLSLKRENPFGGIHFSGLSGIGTNRFLRPMLIKSLRACGVLSVSISDWEISEEGVNDMVKEFRENGFVVSVAGVNTLSYYRRLRKLGVNCIDTDFLTPKALEEVQ